MNQDYENHLLVSEVLSNPKVLWDIRQASVIVVGPWEIAKKPGIEIYNGLWRLLPDGNDFILIHPSTKLNKPESYQYEDWYGEEDFYFDQDGFESDLESYESELLVWKPWTWRRGWDKGYAETKELAQKAADQWLKDHNVLFFD